jgi:hypothetical protein
MRLRALLPGIVLVAAMATAVEAKEYNATYQSKANLKSSCTKGGGKFVTTAGGYLCNFKNGNIKECSNTLKACLILTPK